MTFAIPAALARCCLSARAQIVASLEPQAVRLLNAYFPEWAHAGQKAPAGEWRTWVLMAGRGFGKTRAGAEWVLSLVRGERGSAAASESSGPRTRAAPSPRSRFARVALPREGGGAGRVRIALVAASLDEARR